MTASLDGRQVLQAGGQRSEAGAKRQLRQGVGARELALGLAAEERGRKEGRLQAGEEGGMMSRGGGRQQAGRSGGTAAAAVDSSSRGEPPCVRADQRNKLTCCAKAP